MAREDVEAIKRFFEELNPLMSGNGSLMDLANRYIEPDCTVELGRMEGSRTGPAGFVSYFEGQRAVVEGMRIDPEEFIDIGDGRVVMPFHLHGTARETRLSVDFRYAQLFTMRNGRIAHAHMYANKQRALAAAGLSE